MNRIECGGKVNECNIRTKNDINDKITAKTITAFVCMRLVIAKSMCVNARTIVFFLSMVWFGSVRFESLSILKRHIHAPSAISLSAGTLTLRKDGE